MASESFTEAIGRFALRKDYKPNAERGYRTVHGHFQLNRTTIAMWHKGAVLMYLKHPQYHSWMTANAIVRAKEALTEMGLLSESDEPACKLHEDCRASVDLGKACYAASDNPAPPKSYWDNWETIKARRATLQPGNTQEKGNG